MAEERIKQVKEVGSEQAEGRGAGSDKGRPELTAEQLAGVVGGTTEQVAKGGQEEAQKKSNKT